MRQIIHTIDGQYLFIANSTTCGGTPIYTRFEIATSTFTEAFAPTSGSDGSILQHPTDADIVYFFGQFGGNTNIMRHDVGAGTNTSIGPVTSQVITGLQVNPSDTEQLLCSVNVDEDILYTTDGGTIWTAWDVATGLPTMTDLITLWSMDPDLNRYFVSGDDGVETLIDYSPNEGAEAIKVQDGPLVDGITRMVLTDG